MLAANPPRVDLKWAVAGKANLRVRVVEGLGRPPVSVDISGMRTCLVGSGTDCDLLLRGEDVSPQHLAIAANHRGDVFVLPLVDKGVSMSSPAATGPAATPVALERGKAVPLAMDTILLLGGTFTTVTVTWKEEDEWEIVQSPETWKNTVMNSLVTDSDEAARFHKDAKWQKTKRWTGSLSRKTLSFAANLVEFEGDTLSSTLSLQASVDASDSSVHSDETVAKKRRIDTTPLPAVEETEVLEVAPPLPLPPRYRRNLFVNHPPMPPPPAAASPLALSAFPAFIVGCVAE
eukprot:TRINITY_DN31924_c0_g1_i1.p1 TRINITY_DN31924_c0_g1~~TRINITY_DN31924_c0_g1_i1.p1  ORF type:complete len:290 (+),score=83.91 TRINITY_DN31924_c0_g1_i1:262-1131(+)